MILYHFTHPGHLPSILRDGVLRTTESNVSIKRTHAGPDVLWCFDRPDVPPGTDWSLYEQKRRVMFTIEVGGRGQAVRWLNWKPAVGMDPEWKRQFIKSGGGMGAARRWWVVTRPVPREQWLEVTLDREPIDWRVNAAGREVTG